MKIENHRLPVFILLFSAVFYAALTDCTAQTIRISEVMADNEDTLIDEDGETPDWIELYNTSTNPVSLEGWYLTDTSTNLTRWRFPATNLAANGFLVVFASDKDRASAGSELHANFKLAASGEWLALVRPDGVTIEDRLSFPALEEDISFGYAFIGTEEAAVLLDAGAACSAHVPTNAADSTGWRLPAFDDSAWLSGTSGIGYEAALSSYILYHSLIGLDLLSDMYTQNSSAYIRVPFIVSDPEQVLSLKLKLKYDDEFAAYLNGTRVAISEFAPDPPEWNSASYERRNDDLTLLYTPFDITPHLSALVPGTNVLAIHGINRHEYDNDLLFVPRIEADIAGLIDTSSTGQLDRATPYAVNAPIHYAGNTETPVCSPERGFYDAPFQAVLSNRTAGAVIRYTLDGSEPTESSPEYTGPITIHQTTTLRCRAFFPDWKPSPPRTDTYIFTDDVVQQPVSTNYVGNQILVFGMDEGVLNKEYYDDSGVQITVQSALKSIPSLSITTDHTNLYDPSSGIYVNAAERWERPASFELIYPDGTAGFHINAGLRIRGGWSRHPNFPKHSFRLFFREKYGQGKLNYALFEDEGVSAFDKIDLRTAQNYAWCNSNLDKRLKNSFVRDVFCRDSAGAMGVEYTRSRYYHLYLNGLYWGLFMTEERPVADFGAAYFGGDKDDYDVVKAVSWAEARPRHVEATDGTLDAFYRLYDAAMTGFTNNADFFAVQGLAPDGLPDPGNEKLLDLNNMIDYQLLIYYTGASDNGLTWFGGNAQINNMYALYNRASPDGFKWVQHDCEHALDTSTDLDRTGPFAHTNFTLPQFFNAQTLHEKLSVNAEYRLAFADRVHKHFQHDGALVASNCTARLDLRIAQIDHAIVANAARWGSTLLDRDTWKTATANARAFFPNRVETVIGYLEHDGLLPSIQPPRLDRRSGVLAPGTNVGLSATEGTIYYTTNGTDPRAIGGAIAGTAYSTSVTITRPTRIKARCRSAGGEWSALEEGTFWTPECPLAVTELMYHAPAGNPHDFIEIKNISSNSVSLRGYQLDDAINFKFKHAPQGHLAPGEYLVVADDLDAFCSTYPTGGIMIAGEFSGDLSNSGEEVDLEFYGHDLISFTYSDARNWPLAADGAGHSLVPLDSTMGTQETGILDYGGNWRASTYTNGSPGYADPDDGVTVLLNEIIAHTDTGLDPPFDSNDRIELYNPATAPVILHGWHLSDDSDDLRKWPIPGGTTIPAQGFILFDENDFHPGRTNGFGLDKAGEQLLLSAPGRVADAVRFKGQGNGASWGRYPDGASTWIRTVPTPAVPNQPFNPSVQISELMFNPKQPGDDFEYIQLKNMGTETVTLENAEGPYRIDGGVGFDFPTGVTLLPGERLWILSFNPANTNKLNQFCSARGLAADEEIFLGGYRGKLSDRGERVALEYPQASDDPLLPLDVSWVVIDEVFYFDREPWPDNADGTGYPLIRTGLFDWMAPSAADTDGDKLRDDWEFDYFRSLEHGNQDWDQDGQSDLAELIADTDPTNAASFFSITIGSDDGGRSITWTAAEDRMYNLYWTPDLTQEFRLLESCISYPQACYTDLIHTAESAGFYRMVVMRSEHDADLDGMPDDWEALYSLSDPLADADQDGLKNRSEFIAGTDPTNPSSLLELAISNDDRFRIISWQAQRERMYNLYWTPDLMQEFRLLKAGLIYPQTGYTDLVHTAESSGFYRMVAMRAAYDADLDRMPDDWEALYAVSNALADIDWDGFNNLAEFIAGTDPTDETSYFRIEGSIGQWNGTNAIIMEWDALQDRLYTVYWTTNLLDGFQVLESDLNHPQNSYTGTVESVDHESFYRVDVQLK